MDVKLVSLESVRIASRVVCTPLPADHGVEDVVLPGAGNPLGGGKLVAGNPKARA
eukprot:UN20897